MRGRIFVAAAAAVLVVAVLVVPLPVVVAAPASLLPAADVARVQVSDDLARSDAETEVDGTYLAVAERQRPSAAAVLLAWLQPGRQVDRPAPTPAAEHEEPAVTAALIGLGLSPARMQGAPLPVDVEVDSSVSPAALGVALHLFDTTAAQDAAKGRTILGIGSIEADQTISCPVGAAETAVAARQAGADVVVLAASCELRDNSAAPTVLRAGTFNEAINALLDAGPG